MWAGNERVLYSCSGDFDVGVLGVSCVVVNGVWLYVISRPDFTTESWVVGWLV